MERLDERSVQHMEQPSSSMADVLVAWMIIPVFLALVGWFSLDVDLTDTPDAPTVQVPASLVSTAPLRVIIRGAPTIKAGGFDLRCSECHRLFPSRVDARSTMAQHRHIVLNHGLNDRCLNCHDQSDRNRLRLHDGSTVPFDEAQDLCSNCHGPTFRDWERGMHGRTNGYWNTDLGEQRRLTCTECHNPHSPDIPPMTLLPGPNTLRMGEQGQHDGTGGGGKRNPLRQWNVGGDDLPSREFP